MSDLGPVISGFMELLAPLVGPAVRAFVGTTAGMITCGVAGSAVSIGLCWSAGPLFGLGAGIATLAVWGGLGLVLAGKRAVGRAMVVGLERSALGRRVVDVLFAHLLGVDSKGLHGDRGGVVARTAERIPLQQAETKLRETVEALLQAPDAGGGLGGRLRRKIRDRLLDKVSSLTLARFRQDAAVHGGVDLIQVRDLLAEQADRALADQAQAALKRVTILVVVAAVVAQALVTTAILRLA